MQYLIVTMSWQTRRCCDVLSLRYWQLSRLYRTPSQTAILKHRIVNECANDNIIQFSMLANLFKKTRKKHKKEQSKKKTHRHITSVRCLTGELRVCDARLNCGFIPNTRVFQRVRKREVVNPIAPSLAWCLKHAYEYLVKLLFYPCSALLQSGNLNLHLQIWPFF